MAELWDLLDLDGLPTGRTVARVTDGGDPSGLLQVGDWHRIVQVCLFNPVGEVLIQQRTPNKVTWPNAWDLTAGGSALAGETGQQAASRELREEIGIDYDFTGQRPHLTLSFPRGLFDIYLAEIPNINPANLGIEPDEVQAVRWANRSEILTMIDEGTFCPLHPSLVDLIFAIRTHPGPMQDDGL